MGKKRGENRGVEKKKKGESIGKSDGNKTNSGEKRRV